MFNRFFIKKSFALLTAFYAIGINSGFTTDQDQYDSLCIKGDFGKATTQQILRDNYDNKGRTEGRAKGRIEKHNKSAINPINLTFPKEDTMHITIGSFEPSGNDMLSKSHSTQLINLAQNHLDLVNGYPGNFYGVYLLTNGYNQKGDKINYHYNSNKSASENIKNHYASPNKLTHAHVVLRFGTNPTHGKDQQDGVLKQDAEEMLSDIAKNTPSYGFKDAYGGRKFTSHLTLAAIKSGVGSPNANWPALDSDQVLAVHKQFSDDWNQNNKKTTYTLKNFSLSAEKKLPTRNFIDLGQIQPKVTPQQPQPMVMPQQPLPMGTTQQPQSKVNRQVMLVIQYPEGEHTIFQSNSSSAYSHTYSH